MQPDTLDDFCGIFGLTPEESAAIAAFDRHLIAFNTHTNLIARSTVEARWTRHYADSAQLFPLIPERAPCLVDIGSGAGFPGVVLGIMAQARRPDLELILVESIGKKATFLRECADICNLCNLKVMAERMESVSIPPAGVITARAVTALPKLLDLAGPRLAPDGLMIFPKGRRAEVELDAARERWSMQVERRPSHTDPDATILLIREPRVNADARPSAKAGRS